jgi:hypothetical protein
LNCADLFRDRADGFVELHHAEGGTVYAKLTQSVLLRDGETVAVVGLTDVSELRWLDGHI